MAHSDTVLFKNSAIMWPASDIKLIPKKTRGIYVLFLEEGDFRNVVYIGISAGVIKTGVHGRLRSHERTGKKFSHFSVYEVWDNITKQQVMELEGLFLQIYAKDAHANTLNKNKNYQPLKDTDRKSIDDWVKTV